MPYLVLPAPSTQTFFTNEADPSPYKNRFSRSVMVKDMQRHVVKTTKSRTAVFKKEIVQYLDGNGYLSWSAKSKKYMILGTNSPKDGLVPCRELQNRRADGDKIPNYKKAVYGVLELLRRMQGIITTVTEGQVARHKDAVYRVRLARGHISLLAQAKVEQAVLELYVQEQGLEFVCCRSSICKKRQRAPCFFNYSRINFHKAHCTPLFHIN